MRARAEVWEKVRLDGEEDLKEEQKFERLVLVLKYFFPRSFCNIDCCKWRVAFPTLIRSVVVRGEDEIFGCGD